MSNSTKCFARFFSIFYLTVILVVASSHSFAASSASGLRLSPLRSFPSQAPGSSSVSSLKITNLSDKPQQVSLSTEDFTVVDEVYNYNFKQVDDTAWVKFADSKVVLAGKESKVVSYSLAVPENASPGGHYFALIATADSNVSSGNIVELKRVASLVYLEVSGAIVQKSNLISFETPWFTTSRSIDMDARLNNQGNVHLRGRLKLEQHQWPFGKTVTVEQAEALVLPSTIRLLSQQTKLSAVPGIYRLTATYAPPQGGVVTKTRTILYLPIWAIIGIFLFVVMVIHQSRRVVRKPKKYRYS